MFTETLESRTLMSVSPISTQVAADRLQVRADLLQFRSDIFHNTVTITTDLQALKADGLKNDPTFVPLFKQFHTDIQHMRNELLIERLTEAGNVLHDQSVIIIELRQILLDHGNPPAVTADRAQLLTDRIQLQNDELAGLTARITTRQTDYNTIFADLDQIFAAVSGDTTASPTLLTDVQKFATDRTNTLNTMTTDLQKLITDRTQLVTDLTALQSA